MPTLRVATSAGSPVGVLLQHWRQARRMSQLALAVEAEVSSRHISFIETGRARPSREMVLHLAGALEVPLRERNALLLAAGYAPIYREVGLEAPEADAVRWALAAILRRQEPYPAVVMNRSWDLLEANAAGARFFGFLLGDGARTGPANVIRMMLDPNGLRPYVANWEAVATALLDRVGREAIGGALDGATGELLDEVMSFPGVRHLRRTPGASATLSPVVPVTFEKPPFRFSFFSTVTTLGTPQDALLQELRIESFFPLDEETERNAMALAAEKSPAAHSGPSG